MKIRKTYFCIIIYTIRTVIRGIYWDRTTVIQIYCDVHHFQGGRRASALRLNFHLGDELLPPSLLVETIPCDWLHWSILLELRYKRFMDHKLWYILYFTGISEFFEERNSPRQIFNITYRITFGSPIVLFGWFLIIAKSFHSYSK